MAAGLSSDATAEAAKLALRIGSKAADVISFLADLGEELPSISPVLKTLTAIREKVETVSSNHDELKALEERCTYVTACVVVKCKQNSRSEINLTPLEDCVKAAWKVVERCSRRGRMTRVLKASGEKEELAGLNARVDRLTGDLGLSGIAIVEGKTDDLKALLERVGAKQEVNQEQLLANQDEMLERIRNLPRTPVKLAKVPDGMPVRKTWHVERRDVMETVLDELTHGGLPRLVGLVGDSGAGKTTAASEIVRSKEVREAFSDGIVWLTVNEGAKDRLPFLMTQLARMVFKGVGGRVGRQPAEPDDGAAYVKKCMQKGHGGEGLKCLVVADNVWEVEVVSKLLETGMSILVSTRNAELVAEHGAVVGVDELSEADAESVLRRAAELPPDVRLPDDAADLIELCGRVAMDLAFVGRWSTVRGRRDRRAWLNAARKVRAEMKRAGGDPENRLTETSRTKRRKAVLQAGFEDLATGVDDERVQRLYLSLSMLPDAHGFTLKDAAVLLHDGAPDAQDEASMFGVVEILERWSVLRSVKRWCLGTQHDWTVYFMHDAHSAFARENLMDRGNVRRPALERWMRYLSSLSTLRTHATSELKALWVAAENVGGASWTQARPYVKALGTIDGSDPLLCRSTAALARFQLAQSDWDGATTTCRQLVEVDVAGFLNDYGLHLEVQSLCKLFRKAGRLGESEKLLRLFVAITEAKDGPDTTQVAKRLRGLSECVRKAGRLEEAEQLLVRCLAIEEAKLGPEHVQVAFTLSALARCVREAGRLEEAEQLLRRSLTVLEARLGPQDLSVALALHQLGVCVREAGRLEEAEQLLRRGLTVREAKLGPKDLSVALALRQLGVCVREVGRLEEAEQLLRRGLTVQEAKLGAEDLSVAYTLLPLGVCLQKAGRLGEAEEVLRRCLGIREAKLAPEDVNLADALYHLGVCLRETGRLEEAGDLLTQCLAIQEAAGNCRMGQDNVPMASTVQELELCRKQASRSTKTHALVCATE